MRGCAPSTMIAWLVFAAASPAAAISVQFDYRFDSTGFFDPATELGTAARAALEEAGRIGGLLADPLVEIAPGVGDTWTTGAFLNPGAGGFVSVTDLVVPDDSIVVFVGGRALFGGVLGIASGAEITAASGSDEFLEAVFARGQLGALEAIPTDYGPWGGSIGFSSDVPWHFGTDGGPGTDEQDFLTTATHELLHILGIGESGSWSAQIDSDVFTGPRSRAVYGGDVPLGPYGAHWAEGVMSQVAGLPQEALMDPSTPRGERQLATDLDLAGLSDVGWMLVPEPGTATLLAWGLTWLAGRARTRCGIAAVSSRSGSSRGRDGPVSDALMPC